MEDKPKKHRKRWCCSIISICFGLLLLIIGVIVVRTYKRAFLDSMHLVLVESPKAEKLREAAAARNKAEPGRFKKWANSLNEDASPCHDFNQYTCGLYEARNQPSFWTNLFGSQMKAAETDKQAEFTQCITENLEADKKTNSTAILKMYRYRDEMQSDTDYQIPAPQLLRELQTVANCPAFNKHWSSSTFNLTDAIHKITEFTGEMPFFSLSADRMIDGTMQLIIEAKNLEEIDPESFEDVNEYRLQLLKPKVTGKLIKALLEYTGEQVKDLPANFSQMTSNVVDVYSQVEQFVQSIKYHEQKITLTNDLDVELPMKNDTRLAKIRFNDLDMLIPFVGKDVFLNSPLITPQVRAYLATNPYIRVKSMELFRFLNTLYTKMDKSSMANLLCTDYLVQQMPYMEFDGSTLWQRIGQAVLGWFIDDDMVGNIQSAFPLVVDHLSVEKCTNKSNFREVQVIAENVKAGAEQLLQQNNWMDKESRAQALIKLSSMKMVVGAANSAMNVTLLDQYYEKLQFGVNDTFRDLNFKLQLFTIQKSLEWLIFPERLMETGTVKAYEVNAYNIQTENLIYISPAYIFANFDPSRHAALNYGSIGATVGHEIFHGFDSSGAEFDRHGAIQNWMTEETKKQFYAKAKCYVNQYKQVVDRQLKRRLNGQQTLGENIADNVGLSVAFLAYKIHLNGTSDQKLPGYEQFSDEQMFFTAYGTTGCSKNSFWIQDSLHSDDTHSLGNHRINEALKNSPEFARTYKCPLGSKMNPEKKCKLW